MIDFLAFPMEKYYNRIIRQGPALNIQESRKDDSMKDKSFLSKVNLILILLVAVAAAAAAIYLFRNKLKKLPGRLFGKGDDEPEFDVFDDPDGFDFEEDDSDDKIAEAEPVKAEKHENKVRRGYVRLKFNQAEEA